MPQQADNTDYFSTELAEAKGRSELIAKSLPSIIYAKSLTLKSKIPFKALSLREILIHRVSSLSRAAVEMYEQSNLIPAIVLTRAVVETVAFTFTLQKKLIEFQKSKSPNYLNVFLDRGLVGSRDSDSDISSINVLTLIDHVEKTIPGFRKSYDNLSEYAHPNWAGTLGAFGKFDKEKLELYLGSSERTNGLMSGVIVLSTSLMLFEHYYNEMIEPIKELDAHFEQNAK